MTTEETKHSAIMTLVQLDTVRAGARPAANTTPLSTSIIFHGATKCELLSV